MALDIWGDKPKSQIDPTTIDEEIASLIAAHEADEDAHLEVGESLQSHKASEIIDHLAGSIVTDKLIEGCVTIEKYYEDVFYYRCMFESLDQWNLTIPDSLSTFYIGAGELTILLPDTNGLIISLFNEVQSVSVAYDKNPWFQCRAFLSTDMTAGDFTIMLGNPAPFSNTTKSFGFFWDGSAGKFYARHATGASFVDTEITGLGADTDVELRAEMTDGGDTIKFYVDDVLVATHSSAGCTIDSNSVFGIGLKATDDGYGETPVYVRACIFSQDN